MPIQPLAQSRADQRRFVDRTRETDAIIGAVNASQPVLLLGERGSGRTSLLNHVAWLLARQKEPRDTVMVSGELASNPSQLLGVLVARVQRLAEPGGPRGRWIEDLRALSMPDGPFGQVAQPAILMELVDLLGERLAALERPVCLMVDGIAPSVAHATFGSLRNELWALQGAAWVVAGDSAAEALYREPPADAFFERTVRLDAAHRCRRGEAVARPHTRALRRRHRARDRRRRGQPATATASRRTTSRRASRRRTAATHERARSKPPKPRAPSPVRSSDTSQRTGQRLHPTRRCCARSARVDSGRAS